MSTDSSSSLINCALSSFCLPLAAELCFTIKADWTDDALIRRQTEGLAGRHDLRVHLLRVVHLLTFSWHAFTT